MIQAALLQPILTSHDLQKAILSYNPKYAHKWKFHALHELFENVSYASVTVIPHSVSNISTHLY